MTTILEDTNVSYRVLASTLFVGCVLAANALTAHFGLVPIGFGLMVTAGTFAAGASLIVRDWVQATSPVWWVPVLIVVGAGLSAWVAPPALALASGLAFLAAEAADWAVFTPLRGRLPVAVLASSAVAAPIDTLLFLHLAGFPVTPQAVAGQLLVKTGMSLLVALWLARR